MRSKWGNVFRRGHSAHETRGLGTWVFGSCWEGGDPAIPHFPRLLRGEEITSSFLCAMNNVRRQNHSNRRLDHRKKVDCAPFWGLTMASTAPVRHRIFKFRDMMKWKDIYAVHEAMQLSIWIQMDLVWCVLKICEMRYAHFSEASMIGSSPLWACFCSR